MEVVPEYRDDSLRHRSSLELNTLLHNVATEFTSRKSAGYLALIEYYADHFYRSQCC